MRCFTHTHTRTHAHTLTHPPPPKKKQSSCIDYNRAVLNGNVVFSKTAKPDRLQYDTALLCERVVFHDCRNVTGTPPPAVERWLGEATSLTIVCDRAIVLLLVAFSSLARIWGKCSTIHSSPALFFSLLKWRLVCAH